MKFRYYITNLFDGVVNGTDDEVVAKNHAVCSDFFVVDSQEGVLLLESGETDDIKEVECN